MTGPPRRTSRMSLQAKMTLWTVTVAVLLQSFANFFVLSRYKAGIDSFFDTRLQYRLQTAIDTLGPAGPASDKDLAAITTQFESVGLYERFLLVLYAPDGSVISSSVRPTPPPEKFPLRQALQDSTASAHRTQIAELIDEEGRAPLCRTAARRLELTGKDPAVLVLVGDDRHCRGLLSQTQWLFLTILVIGGGATGVSAWLIAGLISRPFQELRTFTQSLDPEHLHQPVALTSQAAEMAEIREQITQTREKLQAAFRSQERFMLNVSHELKTPIAVVLTEADTLSPELPRDEVVKFVASMREEMRRLGTLIDSFLTLALVQSGKPVGRPSTYMINEFVLDAVHACQKEAQLVRVQLEPTLTTETGAFVYGDPQLLRVMVENLIRNAIRFSPESGRILIAVTVAGDHGVIEVRDFGPGVPAEAISRIFDRFAQATSEINRGRGHGLGLSIAKGIAELHHGRITVENTLPTGCTFTVEIPLAPGQPAAESAPSAHP